MLGGETDIETCGSYGTAEEALDGMKENPPDLMLIDLGWPGKFNGGDSICSAQEMFSEAEVLVHIVFGAQDEVFSAIKAGTFGYILKGASLHEIIEFFMASKMVPPKFPSCHR